MGHMLGWVFPEGTGPSPPPQGLGVHPGLQQPLHLDTASRGQWLSSRVLDTSPSLPNCTCALRRCGLTNLFRASPSYHCSFIAFLLLVFPASPIVATCGSLGTYAWLGFPRGPRGLGRFSLPSSAGPGGPGLQPLHLDTASQGQYGSPVAATPP